jgi:homoserine dehydrogenase
VPVILLTQRVVEKKINDAIRKIEALDTIGAKVRRIRVENLA